MKKASIQLITPILFLFLLGSCTSIKKIQKNLDVQKQSVIYLMDSKPANKRTGKKLTISSIKVNDNIPTQSLAIKETGWFVPLLFVNVWSSRKMCYQGESMYEDNWASMLQKNFQRESNRSGVFELDSNIANYELELSIDELQAKGPYFSNGFYIFAVVIYLYSSGDNAGPAETELAISYTLRKNGIQVQKNTFTVKKETEQLEKGHNTRKKLIQGYSTSMAEATSDNFKNVIESIVGDLNTYFEKE